MKYVVVSAIIFSLLFGSYHLSKSRTYQLFAPIVSHVKTDKPVVALTFDDGPTATHAQTVLDVLSDKDIKATFFVTGRQTLENLDLAKAIVEAGHELGNHSFSHKRMIFKSPNFIRNEIEETDKAIRQAGHIGPIYFRPPYCKKLFVLPWYLRQEKRITVTVNLEPDTYERTAEGMVDYVNQGCQ